MQEHSAPAVAATGVALSIVTPRGVAYSVCCDSVTLPLADGGGVGVRRGHIPAEMALMQGVVRATTNGAPLGNISIAGGFASVKNNIVTVITDGAKIEQPVSHDA